MHLPLLNFTKSSSSALCRLYVKLLFSYRGDRNITKTDCLMSLWVSLYLCWYCLYCLRARLFSYKLGLAADATMIILSLPQALLTPPRPPPLPSFWKRRFAEITFVSFPFFFWFRVYLKLLSLCTQFQSNKFRNSCRYTCTVRC
jgi:hypothetical protein